MSWLDDLFDGWSSDSYDTADMASSAADSIPDTSAWTDYVPDMSSVANNYDSYPSTDWLDSLSQDSGSDYSNLFSSDYDQYPSTSWIDSFSGGAGQQDSTPAYLQINPSTNMPNYATDSDWTGATGPTIMDTLDKYGSMFNSPGGKLLAGLGGAGISAFSTMKQNALLKEQAKKQAEAQAKALAARQAAASVYNAPLHLNNQRRAATPTATGGESAFFTNNRLPSYYADGGRITNPDARSALGFIKYMLAGKKFPSDIREQEEAKRQALIQANTGSAEEGLSKMLNRRQMIEAEEKGAGYYNGGAIGYLDGGSPGQADKVNAQLSDGEYVMDSDVVSALGDGNNAAGAKQLDGMRQAIREHKRSAPSSKIPPKAKSPLEYMKKHKRAK